MRIIRENLFSLALFAVVGAAFAFPQLGAKDGPLHAGMLAKYGVMVIFFLQGLSLRTRELLAGMIDFRLHGFIQGWIFIGSAISLLPAYALLRLAGWPELADGVLFLALLPTTISSAVALTGAAGGNTPASIVSTALANVLGVFWVPLACVLLFASSGVSTTGLVLPMLLKLAEWILMPMACGMLLRPLLQRHAAFPKVQKRFKVVNNSIILFIVWSAFSESILGNAWSGTPLSAFALLLLLIVASIAGIHFAVWHSFPLLLPTAAHDKRISALFCGAQKTLAAGVPMAIAIFASTELQEHVALGPLLLPLMCYHPAQLLLAATLLPRFHTA
jgi:sodium/bile acid cotransporter 7